MVDKPRVTNQTRRQFLGVVSGAAIGLTSTVTARETPSGREPSRHVLFPSRWACIWVARTWSSISCWRKESDAPTRIGSDVRAGVAEFGRTTTHICVARFTGKESLSDTANRPYNAERWANDGWSARDDDGWPYDGRSAWNEDEWKRWAHDGWGERLDDGERPG